MSTSIAVVPDNLHPANHLADGEEAEDLGYDDAALHELGAVDVAGQLHQGGALVSGGLFGGLGGRALDLAAEEAGVVQLSQRPLEVGLEGRHGAERGGHFVS
jgi:hypothetical protein